MEQTIYTGPVKSGTVGGTLLVFFANISSSELMKTGLLAAVGAAVSFIVSFLLKMLFDQVKKRRKGESGE
jgi:uncharacterized membrane protein